MAPGCTQEGTLPRPFPWALHTGLQPLHCLPPPKNWFDATVTVSCVPSISSNFNVSVHIGATKSSQPLEFHCGMADSPLCTIMPKIHYTQFPVTSP